jgi:S-adenosylmethionine synthetase
MAYTYQTMQQYEVRTLEITVIDQDGNAFAPDQVVYSIIDSDNAEVVAETLAAKNSNVIFAEVTTTVTGTIGIYKVVWKLTKTGKIYYHVTQLEVTTL